MSPKEKEEILKECEGVLDTQGFLIIGSKQGEAISSSKLVIIRMDTREVMLLIKNNFDEVTNIVFRQMGIVSSQFENRLIEAGVEKSNS